MQPTSNCFHVEDVRRPNAQDLVYSESTQYGTPWSSKMYAVGQKNIF